MPASVVAVRGDSRLVVILVAGWLGVREHTQRHDWSEKTGRTTASNLHALHDMPVERFAE
jgi:hypothetical protein